MTYGLPPSRLQRLALGHRLGVHVQAGRAILDGAAEQLVQQHVAAVQVVAVVGLDPVLQQRGALHAEARRHRRGLAHVVGLHRPLRHQVVGALRQRLAGQQLQFADLVAAGRHHGAVVALDPDLRPAQVPRQICQLLQRGRRREHADAGETGEMHSGPPELIFRHGRGRRVMSPILMRPTIAAGDVAEAHVR